MLKNCARKQAGQVHTQSNPPAPNKSVSKATEQSTPSEGHITIPEQKCILYPIDPVIPGVESGMYWEIVVQIIERPCKSIHDFNVFDCSLLFLLYL